MAFASSLLKILGSIGKYTPIAVQAVQEAEAAIGPGNGRTKKQVAMAYVLAAAHAGQQVPVANVQAISAAVDLAVAIANSLGAFGGAPKSAEVAVPAVVDPLPGAAIPGSITVHPPA